MTARFLALLAVIGVVPPSYGDAALPPSPSVQIAPLAPRTTREPSAKRFTRLAPEDSGLTAANRFDDPRMWGERFRELTLGAVETGVAVADFDRDGRPDIFAVSKNGPSSLYRQTAPFRFTDVAREAGLVLASEARPSNNGVTAVDINQDGWMDLYLCRYDQPNQLFVNRGDGTFTERASEYGLAIRDASVHATFADYDRDGDLDCYLVTNILDFSKSPLGRRDLLLRNDGAAGFRDVTEAAGIWGLTQGHTALWFDSNHDGWPDLYVANDFETPDRFYLNRGDGTFTDVVDERLPHVTYFSMGADAGDLDGDGRVDFVITDMRDRTHRGFLTGMEEMGRGLWEIERTSRLIPQYMWNAVYLNTGTDRFAEAAHLLGVEATGWTWAVRTADLDDDGRLDLFFTAGMIRNFVEADLIDRQNVAPNLAARAAVWRGAPPRRETTLAFQNQGPLAFTDVSADWGLDELTVSFGCAVADLDGDGDLDLVYANYDAPPTVIRNNSADSHRAVIRLAGRAPNRDAIGAEVRITTEGGTLMRQVYTERGIASSEPAQLHFGLGRHAAIRSLEVRWPSGAQQTLRDLPADSLITVTEPAPGQPSAAIFKTPGSPTAWLAEEASDRGLRSVSAPPPVDELSRQRLLPRRIGSPTPALAAADVNGDGHDDLFVSAAAGQPARLFLGDPSGTFRESPNQPWSAGLPADGAAAAFVDANADGHVDLLVALGGARTPAESDWLRDRLYLNDGQGRFSAAPDSMLPTDRDAAGCIAVGDFDGDGRADVFIGGRLIPGRYPEVPRSRLLRNTGSGFVDITSTAAPELSAAGLVTAALWSDLDGDGRQDLVVASEWGEVARWRNDDGRLRRQDNPGRAPRLTGWWSSLAVADVNHDGRPDIIAGNAGLNTKYRASIDQPTLLFSGAFDSSGRSHLIEAKVSEGVLRPVRGRSKLSYSFPWLPRRFPTYRSYAEASLSDLFAPEFLDQAQRLEANELASGIFIQQADGTFRFERLAPQAQLAPVRAIVVRDLNHDGELDLALVGNSFGPEPSTGRFDGGVGLVLRGDGSGRFVPLAAVDSGLLVPGEANSAVALNVAGRSAIAVARCEGALLLFRERP